MYALVDSPCDDCAPSAIEAATSTAATAQSLPYAEPSTSGTAADDLFSPWTYRDKPSTDTEQDVDPGARAAASSSPDELSDGDVDQPKNVFKNILGSYMFKRNIITKNVSNPFYLSRAAIEFVNFKFIQNNFRSVGLKGFDKISIMQAQMEFESLEHWFTYKIHYISEKQYIKDLRIPLFCHLYLCLFPSFDNKQMLGFLDKFKYLFTSSSGVMLLQELKNVTDINHLSPRLSMFRTNKYVYTVSPEFFGCLNKYFQHHYLLKLVFHEWFDINFDTNENPWVIFDEYYNKQIPKKNNQLEAKTSKQNNDENILDTNNLNKCSDDLRSSTSTGLQEPHSSTLQSKEFKSADNHDKHSQKSTDTQSDNDDKRKNLVDDQSSSSELESLNRKRRREGETVDSGLQRTRITHRKSVKMIGKGQHSRTKDVGGRAVLHIPRKSDKLKNPIYSRVPMAFCPNDSNRTSPSLSSSGEEEQITSNGEENSKTTRTKFKLSGRKPHYISSTDSSTEDSESSEDYVSFIDEETQMRNYFLNKKVTDQHFSYFTQVTKIDVKNLDDDPYLCTTRQIILTNCSKLTCSTLTSDHKYVAAGSLDSLIYLWERSNIPTEVVNVKDVLKIIESKVDSITNFVPTDQNNNYIEMLDKSVAKVLRGHGGSIYDFAELPSAKILLSASNDKTFRTWDLVSKLCLEVFDEHEHRTWCIAACPYSLQVATGSCDGASYLWFLNYKRPLRVFMGHQDDVLVLKFHPNQVHIATGSSDKSIRLFELITGCCKRILVGHSDYITCLEFHSVKPNILASASAAGEIIVWDVPTSAILWTLRVANVLFSELVWFTNDILLGSLTTGIVLKCDTTEDYVKLSKKVKGFTTKFHRLMSLKIVGTTVYTIGIQGKSTLPKPSLKHHKESSQRVENDPIQPKQPHQQQQRLQNESVPGLKQFFSCHVVENNGNSVRSLQGLSSKIVKTSSSEASNQLSFNPKNITQFSQDCLKINLQNLPADIVKKLKSEYQSNHIKLVQSPSKKLKKNQKSALPSPTVQKNVQKTIPINSQILIQSTDGQQTKPNVQVTSINSNQQSTNTHAILQSKITNLQQHKIVNNQLKMNMNLQNLQLQNCRDSNLQLTNTDIHEQHQLQLEDCKETKLSINKVVQQQRQKPQRKPVITRVTPQMIQKSAVHLEQQLQHGVGNSIQIGSTNVLQQPLFHQFRSNTLLAKVNVQQRQQQQTNIQLANINVQQSLSDSAPRTNPRIYDFNAQNTSKPISSLPSTGVPIRLAIRQQKPKSAIQSPTTEQSTVDEYDQMRLAMMDSMLQANPDLFLSGQTTISEIKGSQFMTQSIDLTEPSPGTESQQNGSTQI